MGEGAEALAGRINPLCATRDRGRDSKKIETIITKWGEGVDMGGKG
jgi:hypothetical protein